MSSWELDTGTIAGVVTRLPSKNMEEQCKSLHVLIVELLSAVMITNVAGVTLADDLERLPIR